MEEQADSPEPQKRKRGRPRIYSDTDRALRKFVAGDGKTGPMSRRTEENAYFRIRAQGVLTADPEKRFAWLASQEEKRYQATILGELGRIDNDEDLLAVALRICEEKPTTTDAVAWIRSLRLGRYPQGTSPELLELLRTTLNRYLQTHDGVDLSDARYVLDRLLFEVDVTLAEQRETV
jgi:hypothetical protein